MSRRLIVIASDLMRDHIDRTANTVDYALSLFLGQVQLAAGGPDSVTLAAETTAHINFLPQFARAVATVTPISYILQHNAHSRNTPYHSYRIIRHANPDADPSHKKDTSFAKEHKGSYPLYITYDADSLVTDRYQHLSSGLLAKNCLGQLQASLHILQLDQKLTPATIGSLDSFYNSFRQFSPQLPH